MKNAKIFLMVTAISLMLSMGESKAPLSLLQTGEKMRLAGEEKEP